MDRRESKRQKWTEMFKFAVITVSLQSLHDLGQGYYRSLLITAITMNHLTLIPILLFYKIK